ncbi:hypothetical protein [uncultured Acinetobacter sp.]|uniref:hypothetical protein n=1 Tax=uncultured Acinetobacter sp. TaxID=165433 RepID=UPI0025843AC6|nr:hypothetical protein [uncultured Acinetobacter sp.]
MLTHILAFGAPYLHLETMFGRGCKFIGLCELKQFTEYTLNKINGGNLVSKAKPKKLSNPFSTGGGGGHFENHVQACFVSLMLSGGYAPCLPAWPIDRVNLQGKIDGFDTDDLIVYVKNPDTGEERKLLGQIKHSMAFTEGNDVLEEVIQAAWSDFNNSKIFKKNADAIALITGPLSATDSNSVLWLLNQARYTQNADEYYRNVSQSNFSPSKSETKLAVFRTHLKTANNGVEVSDKELYEFLRHFYVLGFDFGHETGVAISLLQSHFSQFQMQYPKEVWAMVCEQVSTWNQHAGTIIKSKLSEDLLRHFKIKKNMHKFVPQFSDISSSPENWLSYIDATSLVLLALIGSWNEKKSNDLIIFEELFGIKYEEWIVTKSELLALENGPLKLNNGVWVVQSKREIIKLFGNRLLDQHLSKFKEVVVKVLGESNPDLELDKEIRFSAKIYGKEFSYSDHLRAGFTEGLAILGNYSSHLTSSSSYFANNTVNKVIGEILSSTWQQWASLNGLLPDLAEASPDVFLDKIEDILFNNPSLFDEIFSQEGTGISGRNYIVGLLWALERLAWSEINLVRVCCILAELANRDPGGNWANRPVNSIISILLPWMPQTFSSKEKQIVAIRNIIPDYPLVAQKVLIQLLPNQQSISSGTSKPIWSEIDPNKFEINIEDEEFISQSIVFANLLVELSNNNSQLIIELINHIDHLPEESFFLFIENLKKLKVDEIAEDTKEIIWSTLKQFIRRHRRFSDTWWSLDEDKLLQLDEVVKIFLPTDPLYLYKLLFGNRDHDLYEESGDWERQRKKLEEDRKNAIQEILKSSGLDSIVTFTQLVEDSYQVGVSLSSIEDQTIDSFILDLLKKSENKKEYLMIKAYVFNRSKSLGLSWLETIDHLSWSTELKVKFLSILPFNAETWIKVNEWMKDDSNQYWLNVDVQPYQVEADLDVAISNLLEFGRPEVAIDCLYTQIHLRKPINVQFCTQALLEASRVEKLNVYQVQELIEYLQNDLSVESDILASIEYKFLTLLDSNSTVKPKFLENKINNEARFFSEIITKVYRSDKEETKEVELTENDKAQARQFERLLRNWSTIPGQDIDLNFDSEKFKSWFKEVQSLTKESGHLNVAMRVIGRVLVNSPIDKSGLWIDKDIAKLLNEKNNLEMRSAFGSSLITSRGPYWIDQTGEADLKLSEEFFSKADAVENEGFARLAIEVRNVAMYYKKEGERLKHSSQEE